LPISSLNHYYLGVDHRLVMLSRSFLLSFSFPTFQFHSFVRICLSWISHPCYWCFHTYVKLIFYFICPFESLRAFIVDKTGHLVPLLPFASLYYVVLLKYCEYNSILCMQNFQNIFVSLFEMESA
jgi:hypothetical protein